MKFMFLLYVEDSDEDSDEDDAHDGPPSEEDMKRYQDFQEEAAKVATLIGEGALESVESTRAVVFRGGEGIPTDGPFADTKEHLAGFSLYECADMETAVALAAKMPMIAEGRLEVRKLRVFQAGN